MAGRLSVKGSASSLTVRAPWLSRARIARRVGSAKAAKRRLKASSAMLPLIFNKNAK